MRIVETHRKTFESGHRYRVEQNYIRFKGAEDWELVRSYRTLRGARNRIKQDMRFSDAWDYRIVDTQEGRTSLFSKKVTKK